MNKITSFEVPEITDKEMNEIIEYAEKNKPLFPKQYYAAQKSMLLRKVNELHKKSPDLPIKKVLLTIMEPLPDFLPGHNLVTVTEIITSTWEELQQKVAA